MRFLNALFSLLLMPVFSCAQVQVTSLDELLQYADAHGPAAKQARVQPMMARQDINLQASGLYPRVNAFATGDYYPIIATQVIPAEVLGGAPGTYLKAQFGLPYVFQAGAELSMPVVNLEKWAQLSKAKAQYNQAQWGSKAALENFHIELIQSYYQLLVTAEVQELNDENYKTSQELMRIVTARRDAGVLNPADYNRAANLQVDVRATQLNYERALLQNQNALQALIAGEGVIATTENINDFKWPVHSDGTDASTRAAWGEANASVRVAELSLAESRRGGLPRLGLNGRYAYNMQSKLQDGSNNVEFDVASINLRLDVPLFQGSYYRALQTRGRLQLQSVQYERQRTQAKLTRQQADWQAMYHTAYEKNTVLKQKLAAASDNLRIAKLSLEEGVMEFDEFNNIFMEYNRARIEYLQNLADGILNHLLSTQKF